MIHLTLPLEGAALGRQPVVRVDAETACKPALAVAAEFRRWGLEYDAKRGDPKGHLVFAPAKYLSNRQLQEHGVDYAPLPFALYREG